MSIPENCRLDLARAVNPPRITIRQSGQEHFARWSLEAAQPSVRFGLAPVGAGDDFQDNVHQGFFAEFSFPNRRMCSGRCPRDLMKKCRHMDQTIQSTHLAPKLPPEGATPDARSDGFSWSGLKCSILLAER